MVDFCEETVCDWKISYKCFYIRRWKLIPNKCETIFFGHRPVQLSLDFTNQGFKCEFVKGIRLFELWCHNYHL